MGKKLLTTPRSKVRSAIRQVFLRSRERAAALKAAGYTCAACGVKQSRKKGSEVFVECHHKSGGIGNWEKVIDVVYEEILCSPDNLEILCKDCHQKERIPHIQAPGATRRIWSEDI
jgi:predicted HNH restriction endonuclease